MAHLQLSISLDSLVNQTLVFVKLILATGTQNGNVDVAFFSFCGHVVTVRQGLLTSVAWYRAYLVDILYSSNAGSTTPLFLLTSSLFLSTSYFKSLSYLIAYLQRYFLFITKASLYYNLNSYIIINSYNSKQNLFNFKTQ